MVQYRVAVDVVVLKWPTERLKIDDLRDRGIPRLLLIEADEAVPTAPDCLEDWVRVPASDADLAVRRATVAARANLHSVRPTLDDDGVLRFQGSWVGLSPVERDLASPLVEKFGGVVSRGLLADRAWPEGMPSRNALDVHVLRLRRRLEIINLELRTIRARGYLLQATT